MVLVAADLADDVAAMLRDTMERAAAGVDGDGVLPDEDNPDTGGPDAAGADRDASAGPDFVDQPIWDDVDGDLGGDGPDEAGPDADPDEGGDAA
jgi:hypothetical protein